MSSTQSIWTTQRSRYCSLNATWRSVGWDHTVTVIMFPINVIASNALCRIWLIYLQDQSNSVANRFTHKFLVNVYFQVKALIGRCDEQSTTRPLSLSDLQASLVRLQVCLRICMPPLLKLSQSSNNHRWQRCFTWRRRDGWNFSFVWDEEVVVAISYNIHVLRELMYRQIVKQTIGLHDILTSFIVIYEMIHRMNTKCYIKWIWKCTVDNQPGGI